MTRPPQALEIPGRVAMLAEEVATPVVVDAVDFPPSYVEDVTASEPIKPLESVTSARFRAI